MPKVSSGTAFLRVSQADEISWSDLVEEWLTHIKATKKANTHRSYALQMKLWLRWIDAYRDRSGDPVPLSEFRPATLDVYMAFRQESGVSDLTRSYDAKLVRQLLDYAYQMEHIGRRVLRDYKIRRVAARQQRCPEIEEMQRLLAAIDARWDAARPQMRFVRLQERRFYRARDRAILTGLMDTAARVSELLELRVEDVNVDKAQLTFRDTKNGSDRVVPVSAVWIEQYRAWMRLRPKSENERVFISAYGDSIDAGHAGRMFRVYRGLAGLPDDLHLHSLRHYALTALATQDVLAAQRIAGHKDISTTMIYTHTNDEHSRIHHEGAAPLRKILVNKKTEAAKIRRKLV